MINRSLRRKRSQNHMGEISLTPLIDTALVLLVIFIISAPAINNSIKVNLPKGKSQEAQFESKDVSVYIDSLERIFVDEDQVFPENLAHVVGIKVGASTQSKVIVNADQSISYRALVKVVDSIKYLAGVEHVVLATQRD